MPTLPGDIDRRLTLSVNRGSFFGMFYPKGRGVSSGFAAKSIEILIILSLELDCHIRWHCYCFSCFGQDLKDLQLGKGYPAQRTIVRMPLGRKEKIFWVAPVGGSTLRNRPWLCEPGYDLGGRRQRSRNEGRADDRLEAASGEPGTSAAQRYNLGINLNGPNNITLRGDGAHQTGLVFSGHDTCFGQRTYVCM